jgi:hypothetical protein
MAVSMELTVWVGALYTILAMTYIYKETSLFRLAEHSLVGVSAAIVTVLAARQVWSTAVIPLSKGENFLWIVPIAFGVLLYLRYMGGYEWVDRYPIAVIVGVGTAVAMRRLITTQVIGQISGTLLALNSIDNVIIIVGTITSVIYFLFTVEHKGALGGAAKVGRYAIMLYLGSKYAASVAFRFSLLIGRLQFLLWDWLGLVT